MVKVIAFDFGGVVGSESDAFESNFENISNLTGIINERLHEVFSKHWPALKVGAESTLDFWNEIASLSKKDISPQSLEKDYLSHIWVNDEVLEIVAGVKELGYKVVLLPNEARQWMDYKIIKFGFNEIFKKIYCSAYLGMGKPNKNIFHYVINDLQVAPDEILFIDNQENNVLTAQEIGMETILYENPKTLKEKLSSLGLM